MRSLRVYVVSVKNFRILLGEIYYPKGYERTSKEEVEGLRAVLKQSGSFFYAVLY